MIKVPTYIEVCLNRSNAIYRKYTYEMPPHIHREVFYLDKIIHNWIDYTARENHMSYEAIEDILYTSRFGD